MKKITFFEFFLKNTWWLISFLFAGCSIVYMFTDLETFRYTFWFCVFIFMVAFFGSLIHYNRTIK